MEIDTSSLAVNGKRKVRSDSRLVDDGHSESECLSWLVNIRAEISDSTCMLISSLGLDLDMSSVSLRGNYFPSLSHRYVSWLHKILSLETEDEVGRP